MSQGEFDQEDLAAISESACRILNETLEKHYPGTALGVIVVVVQAWCSPWKWAMSGTPETDDSYRVLETVLKRRAIPVTVTLPGHVESVNVTIRFGDRPVWNAWQEFAARFDGSEITEEQRDQARTVFYAGAAAVLATVPNVAAGTTLASAYDELEAFTAEVRSR